MLSKKQKQIGLILFMVFWLVLDLLWFKKIVASTKRLVVECKPELSNSGQIEFPCVATQGSGKDVVTKDSVGAVVELSPESPSSPASPIEVRHGQTGTRGVRKNQAGKIEVLDKAGRVENVDGSPVPVSPFGQSAASVGIFGNAGQSPVTIDLKSPTTEAISGSAAFVGDAKNLTIDVSGKDGIAGVSGGQSAALQVLKGELGGGFNSLKDKLNIGSQASQPSLSGTDLVGVASGCETVGGEGLYKDLDKSPDGEKFIATTLKAREARAQRRICRRETTKEVETRTSCVRPGETNASVSCDYPSIAKTVPVFKRPQENSTIGMSCTNTAPVGTWQTTCGKDTVGAMASVARHEWTALKPAQSIDGSHLYETKHHYTSDMVPPLELPSRVGSLLNTLYGCTGFTSSNFPTDQPFGTTQGTAYTVQDLATSRYTSLATCLLGSVREITGNRGSRIDAMRQAGALVVRNASQDAPGTRALSNVPAREVLGSLEYWSQNSTVHTLDAAKNISVSYRVIDADKPGNKEVFDALKDYGFLPPTQKDATIGHDGVKVTKEELTKPVTYAELMAKKLKAVNSVTSANYAQNVMPNHQFAFSHKIVYEFTNLRAGITLLRDPALAGTPQDGKASYVTSQKTVTGDQMPNMALFIPGGTKIEAVETIRYCPSVEIPEDGVVLRTGEQAMLMGPEIGNGATILVNPSNDPDPTSIQYSGESLGKIAKNQITRALSSHLGREAYTTSDTDIFMGEINGGAAGLPHMERQNFTTNPGNHWFNQQFGYLFPWSNALMRVKDHTTVANCASPITTNRPITNKDVLNKIAFAGGVFVQTSRASSGNPAIEVFYSPFKADKKTKGLTVVESMTPGAYRPRVNIAPATTLGETYGLFDPLGGVVANLKTGDTDSPGGGGSDGKMNRIAGLAKTYGATSTISTSGGTYELRQSGAKTTILLGTDNQTKYQHIVSPPYGAKSIVNRNTFNLSQLNTTVSSEVADAPSAKRHVKTLTGMEFVGAGSEVVQYNYTSGSLLTSRVSTSAGVIGGVQVVCGLPKKNALGAPTLRYPTALLSKVIHHNPALDGSNSNFNGGLRADVNQLYAHRSLELQAVNGSVFPSGSSNVSLYFSPGFTPNSMVGARSGTSGAGVAIEEPITLAQDNNAWLAQLQANSRNNVFGSDGSVIRPITQPDYLPNSLFMSDKTASVESPFDYVARNSDDQTHPISANGGQSWYSDSTIGETDRPKWVGRVDEVLKNEGFHSLPEYARFYIPPGGGGGGSLPPGHTSTTGEGQGHITNSPWAGHSLSSGRFVYSGSGQVNWSVSELTFVPTASSSPFELNQPPYLNLPSAFIRAPGVTGPTGFDSSVTTNSGAKLAKLYGAPNLFGVMTSFVKFGGLPLGIPYTYFANLSKHNKFITSPFAAGIADVVPAFAPEANPREYHKYASSHPSYWNYENASRNPDYVSGLFLPMHRTSEELFSLRNTKDRSAGYTRKPNEMKTPANENLLGNSFVVGARVNGDSWKGNPTTFNLPPVGVTLAPKFDIFTTWRYGSPSEIIPTPENTTQNPGGGGSKPATGIAFAGNGRDMVRNHWMVEKYNRNDGGLAYSGYARPGVGDSVSSVNSIASFHGGKFTNFIKYFSGKINYDLITDTGRAMPVANELVKWRTGGAKTSAFEFDDWVYNDLMGKRIIDPIMDGQSSISMWNTSPTQLIGMDGYLMECEVTGLPEAVAVNQEPLPVFPERNVPTSVTGYNAVTKTDTVFNNTNGSVFDDLGFSKDSANAYNAILPHGVTIDEKGALYFGPLAGPKLMAYGSHNGVDKNLLSAPYAEARTIAGRTNQSITSYTDGAGQPGVVTKIVTAGNTTATTANLDGVQGTVGYFSDFYQKEFAKKANTNAKYIFEPEAALMPELLASFFLQTENTWTGHLAISPASTETPPTANNGLPSAYKETFLDTGVSRADVIIGSNGQSIHQKMPHLAPVVVGLSSQQIAPAVLTFSATYPTTNAIRFAWSLDKDAAGRNRSFIFSAVSLTDFDPGLNLPNNGGPETFVAKDKNLQVYMGSAAILYGSGVQTPFGAPSDTTTRKTATGTDIPVTRTDGLSNPSVAAGGVVLNQGNGIRGVVATIDLRVLPTNTGARWYFVQNLCANTASLATASPTGTPLVNVLRDSGVCSLVPNSLIDPNTVGGGALADLNTKGWSNTFWSLATITDYTPALGDPTNVSVPQTCEAGYSVKSRLFVTSSVSPSSSYKKDAFGVWRNVATNVALEPSLQTPNGACPASQGTRYGTYDVTSFVNPDLCYNPFTGESIPDLRTDKSALSCPKPAGLSGSFLPTVVVDDANRPMSESSSEPLYVFRQSGSAPSSTLPNSLGANGTERMKWNILVGTATVAEFSPKNVLASADLNPSTKGLPQADTEGWIKDVDLAASGANLSCRPVSFNAVTGAMTIINPGTSSLGNSVLTATGFTRDEIYRYGDRDPYVVRLTPERRVLDEVFGTTIASNRTCQDVAALADGNPMVRGGFSVVGTAPSKTEFTQVLESVTTLSDTSALRSQQATPWSTERADGSFEAPDCSIFNDPAQTGGESRWPLVNKLLPKIDGEAPNKFVIGMPGKTFFANNELYEDSSLRTAEPDSAYFAVGGKWIEVGKETLELTRAGSTRPVSCSIRFDGSGIECTDRVRTTSETVEGFQTVIRGDDGENGGIAGQAIVLTSQKPDSLNILANSGKGGKAGSTELGGQSGSQLAKISERTLMCYRTGGTTTDPLIQFYRFNRSVISVTSGSDGRDGTSRTNNVYFGWGIMPQAVDFIKKSVKEQSQKNGW